MRLPRRIRQMADLGDSDDFDDIPDTETFRDLLLAALAEDPDVRGAIRRLVAPVKTSPEPRSARRR